MIMVTYRVRRESPRISPMCPIGAGPRLASAGDTMDGAVRTLASLRAQYPLYRFTLERVTVEILEN